MTPACACLVERKWLGLKLLKSTFNAENFVRRLSWSVSSHFGAVHLKSVLQPKIVKNSLKLPILMGKRSFKVIDVDTTKKVITSSCYDKQRVCA